jgi:predicted AlkP superfamily phosphohydrolase/phosphomutase
LKRQTVLLGLDGATFTVLDPLMREGVMPFLKEFAATGVRSDLRSVIPALTPPAWTSLTTGRSPGHHGIFDFFCKEAADSHHIRIATSRDVQAETIWSLATRHGLRVMALNFPLMFPPPAVDGFVVPGWMPWRQMRLGCHPQDLYDRIKQIPGFDAQELAMDLNPEAKALQGCREDEYEEWVALHIRRERQWFGILRALMLEDPCELTAIVFDGVDRIQHLCWRFLAPTGPLSDSERRVRDRCLEYFRELDAILAEVVSLAGPDATVVFASDHGFGPQTGTFFVNAWLHERGHLAWAADAPRAEGAQALGIEHLAKHDHLLDWTRTRAYAPTPSSNGIHIVKQSAEHPHGVPAAEYERFRDALARELRAVADPATGAPIVARVHTREEAFEGPHKDLAPDLTLDLADGGLISILASDQTYRRRDVPSGTHRAEGIFLARGPGIESGLRLQGLSILEVAPLLLDSLDLEVPAEMERRVPASVHHPSWPRSRPARVSTAARAPEPPAVAPAAPSPDLFTKEDEAKLAQRLRDLGYIE